MLKFSAHESSVLVTINTADGHGIGDGAAATVADRLRVLLLDALGFFKDLRCLLLVRGVVDCTPRSATIKDTVVKCHDAAHCAGSSSSE